MSRLVMFLCLLITIRLSAKNYGVHGHMFPVEEEDLLDYLNNRLQSLEAQEQLELHKKLQTHYTRSFTEPVPVHNLKKATIFRAHYFDPTIIIKGDIKDNQGKVVIPQGTRYNPLKHVSFSQDLLFFDSTYPDQIEWAKSLGDKPKWILVNGRPLDLEEQEGRPIYFDQFGNLCHKLNIRTIPAKVSQEGLRLKIESFPTQREACAK